MFIADDEFFGFNDFWHVRRFHKGALPFGARLNGLVPRHDEVILAGADFQANLVA